MANLEDYMSRPNTKIRSAAKNGWGPGWPDCQFEKQVVVAKAGIFSMSVRNEIAELVAILLQATEEIHRYDVKPRQTGCFDCRAVRGSTTVPSNHSWGLAVDINWNSNPRGEPFRCDLPPAVVPMWWQCGFFWGGWYKKAKVDPMHFEYIHRPRDVAAHLQIAKNILEGDDMPFATSSQELPVGKDVARSYSIPPVESGRLDWGEAFLSVWADLFGGRAAFRIAVGDGQGFTVVSERVTLESGKLFNLRLPKGTRGVSFKRLAADANDPCTASVSFSVEYGRR